MSITHMDMILYACRKHVARQRQLVHHSQAEFQLGRFLFRSQSNGMTEQRCGRLCDNKSIVYIHFAVLDPSVICLGRTFCGGNRIQINKVTVGIVSKYFISHDSFLAYVIYF